MSVFSQTEGSLRPHKQPWLRDDERADARRQRGEGTPLTNKDSHGTVTLRTKQQIIEMRSDRSPWSSCHIK